MREHTWKNILVCHKGVMTKAKVWIAQMTFRFALPNPYSQNKKRVCRGYRFTNSITRDVDENKKGLNVVM